MSRAEEIYPLKRSVEAELEKIRLDPHNSQDILRYYNHRVAEGISYARLRKCLHTLRNLSRILDKPFSDATKEDFVRVIGELERSGIADWTKRDYKVILKHFYRWFRNWEDGSPPEVRWIKKTRGAENKRPILPKDLLTQHEKEAIIDAAENPRDRALFEILLESGRRLGEILTLHIRDIEFDSIGAKLYVNGKTGEDFVRIISSSPSLAIWLDHHPYREQQDSPVWAGLKVSNKSKQMPYHTARDVLKKATMKTGIKKRVFFYLFRHTRVDETQGILTEPQQCMMFGWRFGSTMPATYMKRYGKHIDNAQTIMNGMKPKEKTVVVIKPKICDRCKLENSPTSKFCNRCGFLLDANSSVEFDEKKTILEKLVYGILEDPQTLEKLRSSLKDIVKK